MIYGLVACCGRDDDSLRFDYNNNSFYIDVSEDNKGPYIDNVEYCPWCGILLDTNLIVEKVEEQ